MNSLDIIIDELLAEKVIENIVDPETNLISGQKRRPPNSLELRAANTIIRLRMILESQINRIVELQERLDNYEKNTDVSP